MRARGGRGGACVGFILASAGFDPRNGNIVWNTLVGPGTSLGGVEWGSAYDLQRIYVPIADPFGVPYNLANGQAASGGSWAALDPQTGKIDWQVSTPGGSAALGAASEANGVVYAGDMSPSGDNMFALDASSGNVLWSFPSGAVAFRRRRAEGRRAMRRTLKSLAAV